MSQPPGILALASEIRQRKRKFFKLMSFNEDLKDSNINKCFNINAFILVLWYKAYAGYLE